LNKEVDIHNGNSLFYILLFKYIILSAEMKTMYKIYISKNGYLVCRNYTGLSSTLYVFSMDKKKFTNLGRFVHDSNSSSPDLYVPLNEYVIYAPYQNFAKDKYLDKKVGFEGDVLLKFTIAGNCKASNINILSSTTGNVEFDEAIKKELYAWKWKPTEKGNATVTAIFSFKE